MPFEKGGLWRNWVGNQTCVARYKSAPSTEEQVCQMVAEADALDLNVRYKALLYDGQTNHLLQASLGMIFYAAY